MRVAIFFSFILGLVLAVAALPMAGSAEVATGDQPMVLHSVHDMAGTVKAFESALRDRGVDTIVKVAKSNVAGAEETLVLFADPGHADHARSPRSLDGYDLKFRALVYQDGDSVSIAFDDARALAKRNGMSADDAADAGKVIASVASEAAND